MAIRVAVPHRFTTDDYYRMAEVGLLRKEDRVELIEGEVLQMAPIGSRHSACVTALNDIFHVCGLDAVIWVQCAVQLSTRMQL